MSLPITPIERLAWRQTPTFIKWDDRLSAGAGCSKWRLLDVVLPLMAEAGADTLVCLASAGSSLVAASAYACHQAAYSCHALVRRQVASAGARQAMNLGMTYGCHYHAAPDGVSLRSSSPWVLRFVDDLRAQGARPFLLPFGGTHPLAPRAYIAAGLELASQVRQLEPKPKRVYVAAATGRLALGLAFGLALAKSPLQVVAVGVSADTPASAEAFETLLDEAFAAWTGDAPAVTAVLERLHVVNSSTSAAYGEASDAAQHASALFVQHHNVALDQTYAGRAFAALLADPEPALFWCSGGTWQTPFTRPERDFADFLLPAMAEPALSASGGQIENHVLVC
ncbi:pyridoxal-phosphate dependent enzyme [Parachitinimonas caeni]|uniref:Pyridoxal-phosphate dependent enzyme n=1 Tax=Parachitinimonas caeni TaxID=3031301 RepID=A0ABT7DZD1_9NEIS|nr:pyridoxal-phosphate dependent enzyme [Parachitinimonas caeni]MDK2125422.1 pyridoxal-phosphate dependent enzyme [Parachitinimonas caeni]